MKWEYSIKRMSGVDLGNFWPVQEMLDQMGDDGWELMDIRHNVTDQHRPDLGHADYTFKREAETASEPRHPWAQFLSARHRVIKWRLSDGASFDTVAQELSMDSIQVRLIAQSGIDTVATEDKKL